MTTTKKQLVQIHNSLTNHTTYCDFDEIPRYLTSELKKSENKFVGFSVMVVDKEIEILD